MELCPLHRNINSRGGLKEVEGKRNESRGRNDTMEAFEELLAETELRRRKFISEFYRKYEAENDSDDDIIDLETFCVVKKKKGNSKKNYFKNKKKCTKTLLFGSLCTYSISTEANECITTIKQHIQACSKITFKEMSCYEQNHLSNTLMRSRNSTPIVNKTNLIPIHQASSCKRKIPLNTLTKKFDKNKKFKNHKSKMEIEEDDEVPKLIELYDPAMGKDLTKLDPIIGCASPACEDFSISSIYKKYNEKSIAETAKRMLFYNNPFQSTLYANVNVCSLTLSNCDSSVSELNSLSFNELKIKDKPKSITSAENQDSSTGRANLLDCNNKKKKIKSITKVTSVTDFDFLAGEQNLVKHNPVNKNNKLKKNLPKLSKFVPYYNTRGQNLLKHKSSSENNKSKTSLTTTLSCSAAKFNSLKDDTNIRQNKNNNDSKISISASNLDSPTAGPILSVCKTPVMFSKSKTLASINNFDSLISTPSLRRDSNFDKLQNNEVGTFISVTNFDLSSEKSDFNKLIEKQTSNDKHEAISLTNSVSFSAELNLSKANSSIINNNKKELCLSNANIDFPFVRLDESEIKSYLKQCENRKQSETELHALKFNSFITKLNSSKQVIKEIKNNNMPKAPSFITDLNSVTNEFKSDSVNKYNNNNVPKLSSSQVNSNYHFRKSNKTPKSATSLYSKNYEQYSPTSRKIAVSEECSINASSLPGSAFLSDRLDTKENSKSSKSQTKTISICDMTSTPVCTGRLNSDKNKASFYKKHISANEEESQVISPILNNMAKLPSSNKLFRKKIDKTPQDVTSPNSKKYCELHLSKSRKIAVSEECSLNASSLPGSAFLSDRLDTKENSKSSKSEIKNISICDMTSTPVCTRRLKSDKNKASFYKKHISANEEESRVVSSIVNNMAKLPSSNRLFRKKIDKTPQSVTSPNSKKYCKMHLSKSRKTAVSDECSIACPLSETKYASNTFLSNRVDAKENSKSVKRMLSYKDIPICDITSTPVSTGRQSAKSSRTSLYKKGVFANE
ncbi:hypothetical protein CEXT_243581 [Caerostris extrusa]|uniref:Uncharacterized protein n=1 Tax=Caerostris extrusa TaxID=172846 RepID=A0AAV4RVT2_CAEEX|nr:hypothetical protein CEXT_243581 [Caerostris extrusa]